MKAWLRLFRVVNLPTVPGDVLVGAAAALTVGRHSEFSGLDYVWFARLLAPVWWAAGASVLLYMFGLFDGDWTGRFCWPWCAIALVVAITVYNRSKAWWMMGFCRAMNVLLGAAAVVGGGLKQAECIGLRPMCVAVLWWLYISLVTLYSEGEENDPVKKRRVGLLVGGIVYLQLTALIVLTLEFPQVAAMRPLLVAGAVLLVLLRLFKKAFPEVSAS